MLLYSLYYPRLVRGVGENQKKHEDIFDFMNLYDIIYAWEYVQSPQPSLKEINYETNKLQ